jgi:ABC-type Fe3+-siderophore transport system permease subunit
VVRRTCSRGIWGQRRCRWQQRRQVVKRSRAWPLRAIGDQMTSLNQLISDTTLNHFSEVTSGESTQPVQSLQISPPLEVDIHSHTSDFCSKSRSICVLQHIGVIRCLLQRWSLAHSRMPMRSSHRDSLRDRTKHVSMRKDIRGIVLSFRLPRLRCARIVGAALAIASSESQVTLLST